MVATTIPEGVRRPTIEYDRLIMAVAITHQYEDLLAAIALVIIAVKTGRLKATPDADKRFERKAK